MIGVEDAAVAFEHLRFALAADTAPAEIGRIETHRLDRFQHRLVRADMDGLVGLREADIVRGTARRREKALEMQVLVRPAEIARRPEHPFDHGRRSADVEMRAERLMDEDPCQRNP